jgi:hypothetical protein
MHNGIKMDDFANGQASWISIRLNDPHACVFIWLVSNMREPLNKGTRAFDASETKLKK